MASSEPSPVAPDPTSVPTTSTAIEVAETESRPQAGPLPRKRGEIGYREEEHAEDSLDLERTAEVMPERHPADRDAPPPPSPSPPPPPPINNDEPAVTITPPTDSSSTRSGKRSLISLLRRKKLPHIYGMRLATLFFLLLQLVLLGGTISIWIVSLGIVTKQAQKQDNSDGSVGGSGVVFVHVVFAVSVLAQLLLLERRVFRLRAERYTYLHPGHLLQSTGTGTMGLAPWHRPPLPTYAATLAASGYGTGDVEDHLIAAPPPPPYGNTRGSTLLLSGFLRDSLRAQRPVSESSTRTAGPSRDEERGLDVSEPERARVLEQTLARLEEARPPTPPRATTPSQN